MMCSRMIACFVAVAVAGAGAVAVDRGSTAAGVLPAIGQVITMLNNIASMVETEGQTDQEQHGEYLKWEAAETSQASEHVRQLQTEIQTTNAALADLRSQQGGLQTTVAKIGADITEETSQLNQATERRREENEAFVTDQQNFENAIAACAQGVKILAAHYGDGSTPELSKPQFLSLLDKTIDLMHAAVGKVKHRSPKVVALIQRTLAPFHDPHQPATGEALSIVDEIKDIATTFEEDKQSAIEQENGLQSAYETLRDQKQALIGTLTAEQESQQSQLNQVNQDIAVNEGSLTMAQETLKDRQEYLQMLSEQRSAAEDAYSARQADRQAETAAVRQAVGVLEGVSFVQLQAVHLGAAVGRSEGLKAARARLLSFGKGKAWAARIAVRATHGSTVERFLRARGLSRCPHCSKAATLLREKATVLHSAKLSSAAAIAMGMGNEEIANVISKLEGLITNLDADQHSEDEHKNWCQNERSRVTQKRAGHQAAIIENQQSINSFTELISMKETELEQNQAEIDAETETFEQNTKVRETDKKEYDEDLQDTLDAIAAMNEAIDILANFYASRKAALLQAGSSTDPNSGSQVVQMMSKTRDEFQQAEAALRSAEQAAVTNFATLRANHIQTDGDLRHNRDVITVEKQTAEQALEASREDLANNQGEVAAATSYLTRVGASCDPLIENYDNRKQLRTEEKKAITDAIGVLRDA